MKESLQILGVTSSGLEGIENIVSNKRNDNEVFTEIEQIINPEEREHYLRKLLESKPDGFIKSKLLLAEQIKNKDLKYAVDLILSATLADPVEPKCYLLLAEIAYENKAWLVTNNVCEIVKWLCPEDKSGKKELVVKAEEIFVKTKEKIKSKEPDSSEDEFWRSKNPNKLWILEKLYFQGKIKELTELCFKLLHLFREDINNYETVYKVLVLVDQKKPFERFKDSIENYLKDDHLNKN